MVKVDERGRADAEAAAWLARLQQDERTPQTEAAFQDWLRADGANEAAFARATDVWEMLPGAAAVRELGPSARLVAPPARRRPNRVVEWAVAATLLTGLVAGGLWWMSRPAVYETAAGEQQVKTLRDGSRVSLNTDSRISVSYGGGLRHIALERGEAVFDVEHDPAHPFVVDAGGERVRALGTSFEVRRDEGRVMVTLVRGRVDVSRLGENGAPAVVLARLTPGDRATIAAGGEAVLDRPSVDAVTAWRHGEVVFTNATLQAAAAEINRYGPVKVVVTDAAAAQLPVSGVFETNDATEFAVVMARMNGLRAQRVGQRIELSR
jgi:transmembrane sensor